ncbi:MAG: MFS transporter [Candidatus Aenigmarchaeota archaeon]|nr:MFS transporter [Candidatus Aenigmarchaeota archaeon]
MGIEHNIPKYYLYSFFGLLNFFGPIYILFFQAYSLSLTQIMLFMTVYGVVEIIFEVPTGVISDYMGRKKTMIVGAFFIFLEPLTIVVGHEYWHFIMAYVFLGIGSALLSGTDESIVYDSMIQMRKKRDYKKIYGTYIMFGQIGLIISALVGSYLFEINSKLPYAATAVALFIVVLITMTFVEPKRKMPSKKLYKHMRESIGALRNSRLAYLVTFSILISMGIVLSWFFVQPYYKLVGLRPEQFGVALAVGYIIAAIVARNAHKIEKRLGAKSLIAMPALIVIGYLLLSQFSFLLAFVFFYIISFAQGFSYPILNDYINSHIKSHNRATVLSMNSMIGNVVLAVVAPVMGYIADVYSVQATLLLIAVVTLLLSIALLPKIMKKKA